MNSQTKNQMNKTLCYATSGYALNRNLGSTGFCVETGIMQNDIKENLAELFLANTAIDSTDLEAVYSINKYLTYPLTEVTALSATVIPHGMKKIHLNKVYPLDMSLGDAVKRRRSTRKFTGDFVSVDYLHTILQASSGVTHQLTETHFVRNQRTCPSGGGLYPVKVYVLANKTKQLAKGIYYYDPLQTSFYLIEDQATSIEHFFKSHKINELVNISDCAFILFFNLEIWKSTAKYGSAGLRFGYIEIGGMAQNAHLAAEALGIGSCAYASFDPKVVNNLLRIDGQYESFQHAILCGLSSGDEYARTF